MGKATSKASFRIRSFLYFHNFVLVGDFGLATSSLLEVDPSDVSPGVAALKSDMTLGTDHGLTSSSPHLTC